MNRRMKGCQTRWRRLTNNLTMISTLSAWLRALYPQGPPHPYLHQLWPLFPQQIVQGSLSLTNHSGSLNVESSHCLTLSGGCRRPVQRASQQRSQFYLASVSTHHNHTEAVGPRGCGRVLSSPGSDLGTSFQRAGAHRTERGQGEEGRWQVRESP